MKNCEFYETNNPTKCLKCKQDYAVASFANNLFMCLKFREDGDLCMEANLLSNVTDVDYNVLECKTC